MDIVGIIIAVLAIAIVALTIYYNIMRAKKGKSACGGCHGQCHGCTYYKDPKKRETSK